MIESKNMFQVNAGGSPRRRPGPFGPAWALLPKDQQPLTIDDDTKSADAIERMIDSGYSQLPVRNSEGLINGVFTWKSFGKRVSDLKGTKLAVVDLPVKDTDLEPARFIAPETYIDTETDWGSIDYVLVGDARHLRGILSISDVLGRLNDFAEAFVLLFEVEHEVRDLIGMVYTSPELIEVCEVLATSSRAPLEAAALEIVRLTEGESPIVTVKNHVAAVQKAAKLLREAGRARPLTALEDFTFSQYKSVICSESNWPRFQPVFDTMRELVDADFDDVNKIRNIVFHFRRSITPRDTDRLRRFRDKLRYNRELFQSRRVTSKEVISDALKVHHN